MVEAVFTVERETARTVRFMEVAEPGEGKVNTIYVPKTTLADMGWSEGDQIRVTLDVAKEE